jgi:hypothetical protein
MKSLIVSSLLLLSLICCTEEYNLSVEVTGNGTYQVSPQKSNYEDGETVTLTAIPDSGWLFNKWLGGMNTDYNPIYLRMDGDKYLELVFSIPFEPSMSGDWEAEQYPIDIHIQQAIFDSSLTGTMVIHLPSGSNIQYSITGYNRVSVIVMHCKSAGWADIDYTGWWVNQSRIDGGMREAGIYYECDLIKAGDSQFAGTKLQFKPKIIE